ncbi:hypothetical protein CBR_g21789 [Chara braunii]|uniref:Glycoside hydrolase family 31 N-terminal domain-containing protein n=1 Tax=Chara braunii TaxID=69332 RepID=A0A388JUG3_CHABU|nr:hypothetical protein CBR_g21789 [Chara braunii]|eukprot:GBG61444.1 hypothetical protein CBR_g21789 [Chara braunii]
MAVPMKELNSPFPRRPESLPFIDGRLLFNPGSQHSRTIPVGKNFLATWLQSDGHGILTVHHRSEPDRAVWSSYPGRAFVGGAFCKRHVEERCGSFAVHDRPLRIYNHQSVDKILCVEAESDSEEEKDEEGDAEADVNAEVVIGGEGEDPEELIVSSPPPLYKESSHAVSSRRQVSKGRRGGGRRRRQRRAGLESARFDDHPKLLIKGRLLPPTFHWRKEKPREAQSGLEWLSRIQERLDVDPLMAVPAKELVKSGWEKEGIGYSFEMWEMSDHVLSFAASVEDADEDEEEEEGGRGRDWISEDGMMGIDIGGEYSDVIVEGRDVGEKARLGGGGGGEKSSFRPFVGGQKNEKGGRGAEADKASGFGEWLEKWMRGEWGGSDREKQQHAGRKGANRVILTYLSSEEERFFGFGAQFSYVDLKGRRVPILVQEQGIGRGDVPVTWFANANISRGGGDWYTTYAPVPHYVTSDLRSLYLENNEMSTFDLRRPDLVQIQVHCSEMLGRILHGTSPAELIGRYTELNGRIRKLPKWMVRGPIVGIQGGSARVRELWKKFRDLNVPLGGFWIQDWVGQRLTSVDKQLWWNWEVDVDHYPRWEELVDEMRSSGVRVLTYINPFVMEVNEKANYRRSFFTELEQGGYGVKNRLGDPYMIEYRTFSAALVDLTNPAAKTWLKGAIKDMIRTGISGWMADFGENLPYDCILDSGEDPAVMHNQFPELWASLNREVAEEWEAEVRKRRRDFQEGGMEKRAEVAAGADPYLARDSDDEDESRDGKQAQQKKPQPSGRGDAAAASPAGHDAEAGAAAIATGPTENGQQKAVSEISEDAIMPVMEDKNGDESNGQPKGQEEEVQREEEEEDHEEEEEEEEQLVFFMRSGFRKSPKSCTLFSLGDQMVSWQRHDGIKSAVTGMLSSGFSGFAYNHGDVGGCTTIPVVKYRRSEELLLRWIELGAFMTVFRTHEGSVPEENVQIYDNERTLDQFRRFACVFKAWDFYRIQLVKEAAATGLPVIRHPFLHYPKDKRVFSLSYSQFMVGRDMIVAPVLDRGANMASVYLPYQGEPEEWEHVWTRNIYSTPFQSLLQAPTGSWVKVPAPIGEPAVFVRRGTQLAVHFIANLRKHGLLF